MNKRIQELFSKALDEAVPETWTVLNPEQLSRLKTKFAELIVRECLAICEELGADYDCHFAADEIAKRFLRS